MTMCNRVLRMGKEYFVCIGFHLKNPEGLPPEDVIHLCSFDKKHGEEMEAEGKCKPQNMVSMTKKEAVTLAINLIRACTLHDYEKAKEEKE